MYLWYSIQYNLRIYIAQFSYPHDQLRIKITKWQLTISSCVSVRMSRYWALEKFGEHERGVRVARGATECNSSLLSALQTSQVLNISTYALLKHELIKEWFAHAIARTARGNDNNNNNNTHLFSLVSVNKFKRFLLNFLIKHTVSASSCTAEL